jgi:hypothetical protein
VQLFLGRADDGKKGLGKGKWYKRATWASSTLYFSWRRSPRGILYRHSRQSLSLQFLCERFGEQQTNNLDWYGINILYDENANEEEDQRLVILFSFFILEFSYILSTLFL